MNKNKLEKEINSFIIDIRKNHLKTKKMTKIFKDIQDKSVFF